MITIELVDIPLVKQRSGKQWHFLSHLSGNNACTTNTKCGQSFSNFNLISQISDNIPLEKVCKKCLYICRESLNEKETP